MIKDKIMQMASSDPSFAKGIGAIEAGLGATPIVPEDMDEAIALLEFVLQNPEKYQEVREAAIRDGIIDEGMVPPQYDQTFIVSLLIALYGLRDRTQKKMAHGGLAYAGRKIATGGQGGDTELVHVNRREAEMLRRMGGSGDINPNTGLREYKGIKKILGSVLPIAAAIFVPGLGAAIGGALGASGAAASAIGGAVIGGASSALTGGNIAQGALMGGLGGGLGKIVGGAANKALGLNLGNTGQAMLGSGLVGAGSGLATGQGALKGALQGVAGGAIGQLAGNFAGANAVGQGIGAAGNTFGNALTAGYDPKTAAIAGGLSGLATGMMYKPSDAVVNGLKTAKPDSIFKDSMEAPANTSGGGMSKLVGGLALASSLGGLFSAPKPVQEAVSSLSPEQQEYFNRPSVVWDWDALQRDANASNMALGQYMAQNWNNITSGQYNQAQQTQPPVGHARGGALSAAKYMRGSGSGREDNIDARLSPGEFVFDAETVAMLGDGSNEEGAKLLEEMRTKLRQHKGKALAKGKFSPNAKSPLSYLKGAM